MINDLAIPSPAGALTSASGFVLPAVIADQGDKAAERFFTFFTETIPNPNTRAAYYRHALRFFAWTARQKLTLPAIKSHHVSAYLAGGKWGCHGLASTRAPGLSCGARVRPTRGTRRPVSDHHTAVPHERGN